MTVATRTEPSVVDQPSSHPDRDPADVRLIERWLPIAALGEESVRERRYGTCPYPDCGRVIDGDEIKRQAQAGQMGEQLYAVVFKRRIETRTKSGKRGRDKCERGYRAPRAEDDNSATIAARLAEKLPEWEALDGVPNEIIPDGHKTAEPKRYGMRNWRDLFSARQLLGHGTSVEIFRELLARERNGASLSPLTEAAFVYLALSLDKLRGYNLRMTRWRSKREVMVNTFGRHDFSFKWSFAEMAPLRGGPADGVHFSSRATTPFGCASRCAAGIFHRSAVFNSRICFLVHLTIRPPESDCQSESYR